ncbi:MAG: hypothetical protein NXI04_05995 [Planctomycetaceae bacterium]|nr:hypothetical protein [Planctomycetaceae bacterium]
MASIIRVFVNLLLMLLAVIALTGVAIGDIAPPRPQIPLTQIAVPDPVAVLAGGGLIAAAMWWGAVIARRNGAQTGARLVRAISVVLAGLTIVSSGYAAVEHIMYANTLQRQRRERVWEPPPQYSRSSVDETADQIGASEESIAESAAEPVAEPGPSDNRANDESTDISSPRED